MSHRGTISIPLRPVEPSDTVMTHLTHHRAPHAPERIPRANGLPFQHAWYGGSERGGQVSADEGAKGERGGGGFRVQRETGGSGL